MRRKLVTLLALPLLAISATGCGQAPKPTDPPSQTSTAPESGGTSNSSTGTPTPPAPKGSDPKAFPVNETGAIQFAEHVVMVMSKAFNTGDASEFQALSAPSCTGCNKLIGIMKSQQMARSSVKGVKITLADPKAVFDSGRGTWTVTAMGTMTAESAPGLDGKPTRPEPNTSTIQFTLRHDGTKWLIVDTR